MKNINIKTRYKITIILLFVFISLIIFIFINSESDNKTVITNDTDYTKAISENNKLISRVVSIINLDKVEKNIDSNERQLIQMILFDIIAKNNKNKSHNDIRDIRDAEVREKSYNQTYADSNMLYTTTFIIDIPSLKQSYKVKDLWSPLPPEITGLVDYSARISCPAPDDLIYKDFNCKDFSGEENIDV